MEIVHCTEVYAQEILDILNEAIVNSTALYDYVPRTIDTMGPWFDVKLKSNFPVIGIIDDKNRLLGFGSYGTFRAWPAYKYSVEHSLYVRHDQRGKGYGKIILKQLITAAINQSYHTMIAGIDSNNTNSIKLHKSFDFEFCGRIKHAGYKFSRWLDLDFYQLLLPTPDNPVSE